MTLILPKPDADINPAGPPDWTEHSGGNEFPEWRESIDVGAPAIGWATDSTFADETIGLFGDELLDAEFVVWVEGKLYEIEPLRQLADRAQIVLPSAASGAGTFSPKPYPKSVAFIWPRNFSGYGRPYRINAPEIFWVYPGKKWTALTDMTFRIFGKNLSADLFSPMVVVQKGSDEPYEVTVTEQSEYELTVELPSGYAAGSYQVWVHNGSGGEYGWSNAGTFTVAASTYDYSDEFPVEDETGTDQQKIEAAIAAADSNGGGTVLLAADTYTMTAQLDLDDTIKLKGAGRGLTILSAATEKQIEITGAGCAIEDMTLNGVVINARNVDFTMDNVEQTTVYGYGGLQLYGGSIAGSVDITKDYRSEITNCTFRSENACVVLYNGYHRFSNCEFYGKYTDVFYATLGGSSSVADNLSNHGITAYSAQKVIVENCYFSSEDALGGEIMTRAIWHGHPTNKYFVIKNNTMERIGAFPAADNTNLNTGEVISWEGTAQGLITDVTAVDDFTSVTVDSNAIIGADFGTYTSNNPVGSGLLYVIVASGRGKGQVRQITATATAGASDTKLTVAKWRVLPEVGDRVVVRPLHLGNLVLDNYIDSVPDPTAVTVDFSRTGVLVYDGHHNLVISGNTFKHQLVGVLLFGWTGGADINGDIHVRGNTFEDMTEGGPYNIYATAYMDAAYGTYASGDQFYAWGNVFRDNTISGGELGVCVGAYNYDTAIAPRNDASYTADIDTGIMMSIIENNTISGTDADKALTYAPQANWTLFRGNTLETGQDVTGYSTSKTTSVLDEQ